MSFSSLMLLDRIIEQSIDQNDFIRDHLIKITVVENGLKLTQGDKESLVNLNTHPHVAPLNNEQLKQLLKTVIDRKLDDGSFFRIID